MTQIRLQEVVLQAGTGRTILIWAAIAITSGLSAVVGWYWSSSGAKWLTHTVQVEKRLGDLLNAALDLETGHRGYFLTNDPAYLEPYEAAKSSVFSVHSNLLELLKDNPEQMTLVQSMRPMIEQRLKILEESLALFAAGKTSEAISFIKIGRGKQAMENLRTAIAEARDKEEIYYRERERSFQRQSFALLVALLGMLLATATLALVSISRERERRETVEAAARLLTTSNQELERRVDERTADIEIEKSRAETQRERAEGLLRDVTHRIGNTLALVVGFINLHIRHARDPQSIEILSGARTRIQAIASAQRRLNVTNDLELVRIDTLIDAVLQDFASTTTGETAIVVDIPPLLAAAQFATSLCVLTQEFVMNSIKHAFPDGRTGEIKVSLRELAGGGGVLEIVDNGRGMPTLGTPDDGDSLERTPEGLGAKIATLLSRQFGGSIAYLPANSDHQWPGTRVRIELPEIQLVASKELVGEMA